MLKDKIKVIKLRIHSDERGIFSKLFDYLELKGKNIQDIYVTYTKPGQSRADHYHKKTTEWFCALKGKGSIKFKDVITNEELEVALDSSELSIIEVPPNINHLVVCTGNEELVLLAFGNQPYTKEDPDTYAK